MFQIKKQQADVRVPTFRRPNRPNSKSRCHRWFQTELLDLRIKGIKSGFASNGYGAESAYENIDHRSSCNENIRTKCRYIPGSHNFLISCGPIAKETVMKKVKETAKKESARGHLRIKCKTKQHSVLHYLCIKQVCLNWAKRRPRLDNEDFHVIENTLALVRNFNNKGERQK